MSSLRPSPSVALSGLRLQGTPVDVACHPGDLLTASASSNPRRGLDADPTLLIEIRPRLPLVRERVRYNGVLACFERPRAGTKRVRPVDRRTPRIEVCGNVGWPGHRGPGTLRVAGYVGLSARS